MPSSSETEPRWVAEVLDFWFREIGPTNWFAKSDDVDGQIRSRFDRLHEQVSLEDPTALVTPRAALAAVIVLDQFSRNMFRGSPRAFASDPLARRLAADAVARGLDRDLTPDQRLFLYLPFEHSEDRADQARSVELIGQLGNERWTLYAEAHRTIIDRFGRFPHRNAILGRTSTPEELELLKDPMGSF
ncbi:MAG: DUF924 domain-containing protein [Gammaproteobacteria bacterium]|nr:DUF924 domain-containing protein [Gammaproteobacteria bacterium]